MWHAWGTGEVHTGFRWEDLRERDQLQDLGIDGRILKWMCRETGWGGMDWIALA
jgi:hypothetical protein